MSLTVKVEGRQDFDRFSRGCRQAAKTGIDKEFRRGLKEAGQVLEKAVRQSTDTFMPKGFEDTFRTRLTTTVEVRGMKVSVTFWGRGRFTRRDVERMEAGILRHPVFGRTRMTKRGRVANPWHAQRIKPGWVSVPVKASTTAAISKLDTAVGRVFVTISKAA